MKSEGHSIGIFGGTFDPVHIGHLIVAEWLTEMLEIKTTFFVPAKIHPFFKRENISSAEDRLNMLQLAIQDYPLFQVNEIELKREGISYSVDTVAAFRDLYPSETLYFFMGMDNLNSFQEWKEPLELLKMCYVVVYNRGEKIEQNNWLEHPRVISVDSPLVEISSSHIRQRIKKGLAFKSLVPHHVFEYITQKKLYHL